MRPIKKYAKILKRKLAYEEILNDLHKDVLRDLKKCKDGQAISDNVEFHLTTKTSKEYPESVKEEVKKIRKEAEDNGDVKVKENPSFDAYIPKSVKDDVLGQIPDYRKHFGIQL